MDADGGRVVECAAEVRVEICRTMLQMILASNDLGLNALTCSSSLRFNAGRMEVLCQFLLQMGCWFKV